MDIIRIIIHNKKYKWIILYVKNRWKQFTKKENFRNISHVSHDLDILSMCYCHYLYFYWCRTQTLLALGLCLILFKLKKNERKLCIHTLLLRLENGIQLYYKNLYVNLYSKIYSWHIHSIPHAGSFLGIINAHKSVLTFIGGVNKMSSVNDVTLLRERLPNVHLTICDDGVFYQTWRQKK